MGSNNIENIENVENTVEVKEKKANKLIAWLKAHKKGLKVGGGVLAVILGLGAAGGVGYKLGYTEGLDRVGELATKAAESLPEAAASVGEAITDAVESAVE